VLVNPTEHWHSALPEEASALSLHVSHPAAPPALLNVPAGHALHATPSEAAVYPGRHAQSVKSLLPAAEVEFKGQAVQLSDPVVTLNVPASHAAHSTPSEAAVYHGTVCPGRHLQSASSLLPATEVVFEGHAAQLPDPAVALYVPAKHALHAPPSAPVNPTEHRHSALPEEDSALAGQVSHPAVPASLLNVPAGHALHATPAEAAVYPGRHAQSASSLLPATEMVFEGHAAQLPDPAMALCVPASHAMHVPPSAPVYPGGQSPRQCGTADRLSPISPF